MNYFQIKSSYYPKLKIIWKIKAIKKQNKSYLGIKEIQKIDIQLAIIENSI